jgi:Mg-chelatase subunit ChlD
MLLAFGVLTLPLWGQQDFCAEQMIFASVENEKGQPVDGLIAANFHAALNKQTISVSLAEPYPYRRILIVFDTSGSMHIPFVVKASSLAAVNVIHQSTSGIQFAFATFSDHFEMRENFTADHEEMAQAIVRDLRAIPQINVPMMKPSTPTSAVFDSAIAGINALSPRETGDVVLLITDGMDDTSRTKQVEQTAMSNVQSSGVRLFAIILTSPFSRMESNFDSSQKRFERMVEGAGGEFFRLGSDTDYPLRQTHPRQIEFGVKVDFQNMPDIADSLLRYMATAYRLRISPPANISKPEDWKLEVTGGSGEKNHALYIRYQPRLFPCVATFKPQ